MERERGIVFGFGGGEPAAAQVAKELGWRLGRAEHHRFPDGESLVRVLDPVGGARQTVVVCPLDRPDEKTVPLVFLGRTLRELGAGRVGLVAPYLAYMRQDKRFRPGESLSNRLYADMLSSAFDWVTTVDPHLHRIAGLESLFRVPARVQHATAPLGVWIARNVENPFLIGPDDESRQWVAAVAAHAGARYAVLEKVRRGDRDVEIRMPAGFDLAGRTPVLVDDIISTGRTMIETVRLLRAQGSANPVCVGVHAVFAGNAWEDLKAAGAGRIVTTDAIPHPTNAISLAPLLAEGVREMAARVSA